MHDSVALCRGKAHSPDLMFFSATEKPDPAPPHLRDLPPLKTSSLSFVFSRCKQVGEKTEGLAKVLTKRPAFQFERNQFELPSS